MDDDTLSAVRAVVRGEADEADARFRGEIIPRAYCALYEAADAADRDLWLMSLANWSLTKSWAWEALVEILRAYRARREPVPAVLSEWAETVALGEREPCRVGRGRPNNDERDLRILAAVRVLRKSGLSEWKAFEVVADALSEPGKSFEPESVRSAVRKLQRMRLFKGQYKAADRAHRGACDPQKKRRSCQKQPTVVGLKCAINAG